MDKKDRLKEAYTYLKDKGIVHTQKEVAARIGASAQNVSSAFNGVESVLTDKFLHRFNNAFGNSFNIDWLLTGEGSMLTQGSPSAQEENPAGSAIKYYPNVDGSMGGVQFLENPDEAALDISIPGYSDCKYAINAYGDSMYPLIQSGQIVLLAPWQESFIDWGSIYLVVTKTGYRTIKRLYPATNGEYILCKSENAATNPPFEVKRDEIVSLFLVKGWICRNEI